MKQIFSKAYCSKKQIKEHSLGRIPSNLQGKVSHTHCYTLHLKIIVKHITKFNHFKNCITKNQHYVKFNTIKLLINIINIVLLQCAEDKYDKALIRTQETLLITNKNKVKQFH